ncbi:FAD-binding domain-containing protein [Mytilinidion resinicola]|uniref:FAD-binding domain-containing protein n=1 Tax=Mytilinidion resinicola TaxID=574789 RepID=A0A6A6Y1Z7_9PEZI|nr:FAD-binding domain-containing protein [Mytilinidion resinicola]KAF2802245.1 FAD-binding domain-containing protein [Mytilinidion resinicola]
MFSLCSQICRFAVVLCIGFCFVAVEALPGLNATQNELQSTGSCCDTLDYFLPGKVHDDTILDLDAAYEASLASYYSQQEQSLNPTCIVIPTTNEDVATAVFILNTAYKLSLSGCKFAIRSGGHTPQAGAANIEGGITIDLQQLNQVTISTDKSFAGIGPGNRWINIYPTLDAQGLTMVGGRVSTVGVGGLMTGGGVSFYSGRYGFACDNIYNFEVVLASGAIVNANSTSNPNLFRALKGGSNNFGVVTRFDVRLFQQGKLWGGTYTQIPTPETRTDVFNFIHNFTKSATYDPYAALISNFAWEAGVIELIVNDVEYTKPTPLPPAFEGLFDIPGVSTMRVDYLSSFTTEIAVASSTTNGKSNMFATLTFINDAAFMAELYALADAMVTDLNTHVLGLLFTMTYQPLPHAIYSKSAASNVLGLDRFTDDFINLLAVVSWQLASDDATVYTAVEKLFGDAEAAAKQRGLWNEFVYLNYAASWQKPITGYGEESKAFLESVSEVYDPGQLFQVGVPGGFKLATG